jgi:phosphoenolpyruvate synthase/pyruvate phosphate dikinase
VGYLAPLEALRGTDEPRFGGKSANLGELLAAGIPAPGGFAIAAGADESVWDDVVARYASLGDEVPVAVRSSGVGEDSTEATFAGQYESYLWVRGADAVCDAVRKCWDSAGSSSAAAYREHVGRDTVSMGVTVQLMVDALVSGVMFTCNPVSGDPSMVSINASWGLGLAVVGGEVTPDDYLVSKVTGEIVAEHVHLKEVEYAPDPARGGTVRLEAERASAPCLDADRLAALLDVAGRVQRHFGSHQDVEWAIDRGGELFVLQARPVTAVRKPEAKPAPADALSLLMKTFGAKR